MDDPFDDPDELLRSVYAYVAYRVGDGPRAEDITSEVLERALKYRSSYKPSLGSPTAWAVGIARRCIAGDEPYKPRVDDEPVDPGQESDENVIARVDLARAMATLTDHERELVALRYGADLRSREIAELLFLRTNTVEVALHRALTKLRSALSASIDQTV